METPEGLRLGPDLFSTVFWNYNLLLSIQAVPCEAELNRNWCFSLIAVLSRIKHSPLSPTPLSHNFPRKTELSKIPWEPSVHVELLPKVKLAYF